MGLIVRPDVSLDDKYLTEEGRVFMTGIQALVRLPMLRRRADALTGLNTAGFISGYRGSPLGGYDAQLWKARRFLESHHVVFQPGINEDLGATAVWGSQYTNLFPGARYDGVFGIWYGKGPGVDRCGDAFKHANMAGTSPHGGVLALAGDDHACKSSTYPNQSEFAFIDAEIPVLNPMNLGEVLSFGMQGLAMSRYAGLWVGMKTIADTMDSTATVDVSLDAYKSHDPVDFELPPGGLNIQVGEKPAAAEERHRLFRLPAAQAFGRSNGFDRIMLDSPNSRFGILTTGKAYLHVRQALHELGIDEELARDWGLRIYKVGLVWPLDPKGLVHFAKGLEEVLVVEERRDVLEHQVKAALFNLPESLRPRVSGKADPQGKPLIRSTLDLDTPAVVRAILARLPSGLRPPRGDAVMARLGEATSAPEKVIPLHTRDAFFCSGCPHNRSTKLPDGSRATAGIGCHFLVQWMDRGADVCTHMGGEGVPWIGQAPFTTEKHIFANLGDGTYFHSGSLAIRQAIAAGVNITFKILYNDAVAMTGGQPVDGRLSVADIVAQVAAEGVRRIAIVTENPEHFVGVAAIPTWVTVDPRTQLDTIQKDLREFEGCSVLIYDQTCATEKRRRRKHGKLNTPARRLIINEHVCEGCGDCGKKSNCISVEPLETEFGRKRTIDQSSCNQDFSCVEGFCPSFVSVIDGKRRKLDKVALPSVPLPDPTLPSVAHEPWNMMLTGIGGQGVTALAAIIGMATHLEGKRLVVVDQLGMAQKGGGVYSHVRIAYGAGDIHSPRIGPGQADVLIASDMVVGHGPTALPSLSDERTAAIVSDRVAPTAEFLTNNDIAYDADGMLGALRQRTRTLEAIPAHPIVLELLGDAIYLNVFLLGIAYQRGLVPLSADAIEKAIELNGASVEKNQRAFRWGRHYAHDPISIPVRAAPERIAFTLEDIVERRRADLAAYQSEAYARRYVDFVERVRRAEAERVGGADAFARTVARTMHRLMAYKDEYEIARLFTDGRFEERLAREYEGPVRLQFHLAPPLFSPRDPDTGLPVKRTFGRWMLGAMRLLAPFKVLRGTPLDPFGYTAERRAERRMVEDYEVEISSLASRLSPRNHSLAVEIAAVPLSVRGFGHVKDENANLARRRRDDLVARFEAQSRLVDARASAGAPEVQEKETTG